MATQFAVDLVFKSQGVNNIREFERQLQGVTDQAKTAGSSLEKAAAQGSAGFGALKAAIAGLGIGLLAKDIASVGDASQKSKIQLSTLAGAYGELEVASSAVQRIQSVLGVSAIDAREGYSQLYAALRGTGVSAQQLEVLFVGLTKAARLSGAGAQEAQGALLQLKQGLASGVLAGDELRAVLESMPALTQQLAKDLGVTVGELKKLGAEGRITSDVLFKAAQTLATSAVPAMTTTESLGVAFQNLKEKIAEAFGPAIVGAMASFTAVIKVAGAAITAWREPLTGIVTGLVNFAKTMAPIAAGIAVVIGAMKAWALAQKAVQVGQAAILAMSGPGGWALIAAGIGASVAAAAAFDAGMKKVNEGMAQISAETAKAKQEFIDMATTAPGLQAGVGAVQAQAEQMKKAFEAGKLAIEGQYSALQRASEAQTQQADNNQRIAEARIAAEQAINQVYLEQAQRQLQAAKSQGDRVTAAQMIYDLTVRQAELEFSASQVSIASEVQKSQIALEAARVKQQELAAVVALAEAQGVATAKHQEALAAQTAAVQMSQQMLQTTTQVAEQQLRAADALFRGRVAAAEAAYSQNIVASATETAANSAGTFATNMSNAASYAQAAAGAVNAIASALASNGAGMGSGLFHGMGLGAAGNNGDFMGWAQGEMDRLFNKGGIAGGMLWEQDYARLKAQIAEAANRFNNNGRSPSTPPSYGRYAEGGYVTKPTNALIGEGGEAEYVIPASKMSSAMMNYAQGRRGDAVLQDPQISVTYAGNIMQMDNQNYLSTNAVPGIINDAVKQTIGAIRRNPALRREIGVTR